MIGDAADTLPPEAPEQGSPAAPEPTVQEGEAKKGGKPKRGSRCPESTASSETLEPWCVANGVPFPLTPAASQFLDHHASKGNTMVSWAAAWRTWERNEKRFSPRVVNGGRNAVQPASATPHWYPKVL